LDEITEDLSAYFQQKNNLRKQLISSLSYPILILVLATCVVIFMLQFVVPLFADIFKQNNVDFPWITQQIISASDFISNYGTLLLLVLVVIIVGVKLLSKEFWFQKYLSVVQLKTPILGVYLKQIYLVQFTQAMVLLTRSKIPLVKAVGLVKDMIQFYPLQQALDAIEQNMLQGEKLHDSFARHRLFDRKMITLLKVAEETNNTEYSFAKLHEMYKAELDYKGKIMLSFFNFLLTAIVGLIVGIIVIAMYLPMFKLSSALG
jgi:type IV pilus assembly protein PilC